ncbi:membrane-spanning 4-domains subfamily A member 15-like [Cetorhinus maximus]
MSALADSPQALNVTVTHLFKTDPPSPGTGAPTCPQTAYAQKFLEGEPKALGVTQIMNGLVQILFGMPLALFTDYFSVRYSLPFLIGIVFIVSGALSIAAEKNPHIKLLRACLAVNATSSFLAGYGTIGYILDMAKARGCAHDALHCHEMPQFNTLMYYTFIVLLLFTLLEFTVCITICLFICKSTRCCHAYSSMPVALMGRNLMDSE